MQEQCGAKTFQAIERLRSLAKQIRKNPDPKLLEAAESAVRELSSRQATEVAAAFSPLFSPRQPLRGTRAGTPPDCLCLAGSGRADVLAPDLQRVAAPGNSGYPAQAPASIHAHRAGSNRPPTEAKRRSVLNHILRIGRTLEFLQGGPRAAAEQAIDPSIEALWLTDEVRESPVTPQIESENARFYLERTIYDLAGTFWEKFCDELFRYDPRLPEPQPFLSFGSWVGTDRDGNPNVTPATSKEAAEEVRKSILATTTRVAGAC